MNFASSRIINKKSVVLLVVAIGLTLPMTSWALSPVIQLLGGLIFAFFFWPFLLILEIEMWLLPVLANYNSFIHEKGVITGWKALRDLANMFFILILLIISFATIIRAQGYGYKQTLSRLIIVAILINFSRLIVGVLIDFSQVIMLTFTQAFTNVLQGNLMVALGLANVINSGEGAITDTAYMQALLWGIIMLIPSVVVIGAFIGILAFRIVKLWILIIMSPMAFLSYVLPKTQSFYTRWVGDLGKNLFSGPTLAFFLWLTFTITGSGKINEKFLDNQVDTGESRRAISQSAAGSNVVNFIIAIAMLAGSLQIVGASGAAGASFAQAGSNKFQSVASKAQRAGGKTFNYATGKPYSLAWKGTSGEGGMKGGLNTGRGWAGSILARSSSGTISRLGQRQQAAVQESKAREVAYVARGADRIVDERERQAYLESYSQRGRGHGFSAQILLDRERAKSAEPIDAADANDMLARAQRVGDREQIKALRAKSGAVHTEESISQMFQEKGPGAFSGMNLEGATDEVIEAILSLLDEDGLDKAFSGMSKDLRRRGVAAIDTSMRSRGANFGSTIDPTTGRTVTYTAADEGSAMFKARALQLKHDAGKADTNGLAATYNGLGDPEKAKLFRAAKMDGTDMLKIKHDNNPANAASLQMFRNITGAQASQAQSSNMLSNASSEEDLKEITSARVRAGHIEEMNNGRTMQHINNADIGHYMSTRITRATTAPAAQQIRRDESSRNLGHAHVIYGGARHQAEFVNFVESATIEQLKKMDKDALRNLRATTPTLSAETKTKLTTIGVT